MVIKNWLPQFAPEIVQDGFGNKLCSYLIALEGWRRGLVLTINDGKFKRYSLSSPQRTHHFNKSSIDLNLKPARAICRKKDKTKEILAKSGIPVPSGRLFSAEESDEKIVRFVEDFGFPVVLKPVIGSLGKGVITGIRDVKTLRDYLIYVRQELGKPDVLIEQNISGQDYRVFVVEDIVTGALKRIPANITGDGQDTIRQLIKKKNEDKSKNPYLSNSLIKLDKEVLNYIANAGYSLDTVLGAGEVLYLRGKANLSAGGDSVDVTDELSETAKRTAIDAVKAVPGLRYCGVDLLVDTANGDTTSVVIELNWRSHIGMYVYPTFGIARNIPKIILDTYFPESITATRCAAKDIVFNLDSALKPLIEGVANKVTLAPAPVGEINAKVIEIKGKNNSLKFRKWVRKTARELKLNGYIKKLKNGNLRIVLAGGKEKMSEVNTCFKNSKFKVKILSIKRWDKPVKVGFEIN